MEYKLSPSNLNLLEDCPRCFWLHMVKKIKRPMGPMSSIPIKMDSIIKHYFDRYRGQRRSDGSEMTTVRLPEKCPSCGASISQEGINWTGPLEAECSYCGSTLRATFERV